MTESKRASRPSMLLIQANPYAFAVFLVAYWLLTIAISVMAQSFIFFGVMLLFTLPFVLLATAMWAVVKAIVRMIFFEL